MRIRDIVLEGFKSYATRTTVSPFDEHFNAITGLNGSGKPNILNGYHIIISSSCPSFIRFYIRINKVQLV